MSPPPSVPIRPTPGGRLAPTALLLASALLVATPSRAAAQESPSPARATGEESASPATSPAAARPQVLVVALDGLEPTLVRELLAEGRLPNLARLIGRGTMTTIECVVGSTSPVVWTTVMTGVPPERHGITDFTVDGVPATSTARRVPALWNVLPRHDLRSAVFGWLVTWPAEARSGVMVSDRAYWGRFDDKVSPPGVLDPAAYHFNGVADTSFLPRFTSWPYDADLSDRTPDDPSYAVDFLVHRRLVNAWVHDTTFARMAEDLASRYTVDLLAVYFQAADYTGHGFWKWHEPEPFRAAGVAVDDAELAALGDVVRNAYVFLDELVGRMTALVDDDALVVVLSDHGMGPGLGDYAVEGDFLSGNHRDEGVLVLSGPMVRRGVAPQERITHYDVLPTLLLALDLPQVLDHRGRPLLECFTDAFLAERRLRFEPTWGPRDGGGAVERSEHDQEILDELRSLGYLK